MTQQLVGWVTDRLNRKLAEGKHFDGGEPVDCGEYVGRHQLSSSWKWRGLHVDGPFYRVNLHGGAYK